MIKLSRIDHNESCYSTANNLHFIAARCIRLYESVHNINCTSFAQNSLYYLHFVITSFSLFYDVLSVWKVSDLPDHGNHNQCTMLLRSYTFGYLSHFSLFITISLSRDAGAYSWVRGWGRVASAQWAWQCGLGVEPLKIFINTPLDQGSRHEDLSGGARNSIKFEICPTMLGWQIKLCVPKSFWYPQKQPFIPQIMNKNL